MQSTQHPLEVEVAAVVAEWKRLGPLTWQVSNQQQPKEEGKGSTAEVAIADAVVLHRRIQQHLLTLSQTTSTTTAPPTAGGGKGSRVKVLRETLREVAEEMEERDELRGRLNHAPTPATTTAVGGPQPAGVSAPAVSQPSYASSEGPPICPPRLTKKKKQQGDGVQQQQPHDHQYHYHQEVKHYHDSLVGGGRCPIPGVNTGDWDGLSSSLLSPYPHRVSSIVASGTSAASSGECDGGDDTMVTLISMNEKWAWGGSFTHHHQQQEQPQQQPQRCHHVFVMLETDVCSMGRVPFRTTFSDAPRLFDRAGLPRQSFVPPSSEVALSPPGSGTTSTAIRATGMLVVLTDDLNPSVTCLAQVMAAQGGQAGKNPAEVGYISLQVPTPTTGSAAAAGSIKMPKGYEESAVLSINFFTTTPVVGVGVEEEEPHTRHKHQKQQEAPPPLSSLRWEAAVRHDAVQAALRQWCSPGVHVGWLTIAADGSVQVPAPSSSTGSPSLDYWGYMGGGGTYTKTKPSSKTATTTEAAAAGTEKAPPPEPSPGKKKKKRVEDVKEESLLPLPASSPAFPTPSQVPMEQPPPPPPAPVLEVTSDDVALLEGIVLEDFTAAVDTAEVMPLLVAKNPARYGASKDLRKAIVAAALEREGAVLVKHNKKNTAYLDSATRKAHQSEQQRKEKDVKKGKKTNAPPPPPTAAPPQKQPSAPKVDSSLLTPPPAALEREIDELKSLGRSPTTWKNLGVRMLVLNVPSVRVAASVYSALDCFLEGIKCTPHSAQLANDQLLCLASAMKPDQRVKIRGKSWTREEVLQEVLALGPANPTQQDRWFINRLDLECEKKNTTCRLLFALWFADTPSHVDKAFDAFIYVLESDDDVRHKAWGALGCLLLNRGQMAQAGGRLNKRVAVVHGVEYTASACFAKAVECAPSVAWKEKAWQLLAKALSRMNMTEKVSGVVHTALDCYLELLRLKPDVAGNWYQVASMLHPLDPPVAVNGELFSKLECYVNAAELGHPFPYLHIGHLLLGIDDNGAPVDVPNLPSFVTVRGARYTPHQLLTKSIEDLRNPRSQMSKFYPPTSVEEKVADQARIWFSLGMGMNDADCVTVSKENYTKLGCLVRAIHLKLSTCSLVLVSAMGEIYRLMITTGERPCFDPNLFPTPDGMDVSHILAAVLLKSGIYFRPTPVLSHRIVQQALLLWREVYLSDEMRLQFSHLHPSGFSQLYLLSQRLRFGDPDPVLWKLLAREMEKTGKAGVDINGIIYSVEECYEQCEKKKDDAA